MRKRQPKNDVPNTIELYLQDVANATTDAEREAAKKNFERAMAPLWRKLRIVMSNSDQVVTDTNASVSESKRGDDSD